LPQEPLRESEVAYWLTPVKSDEEETAEEVIQTLVGHERIYAFGERTPGRRHLKPGDWMCFYATTKGVVAHGKVLSAPVKKPHRKVRDPETYPWVFRLDNVQLYLNDPIVLDATVRSQLHAFQGRNLNRSWAWFVQATRRIDEYDFNILTRRKMQG
ncbi:MAG: EVE domain-containing protein, partial [archaeon]|nr:EVE domain-containing protein [archaeon]